MWNLAGEGRENCIVSTFWDFFTKQVRGRVVHRKGLNPSNIQNVKTLYWIDWSQCQWLCLFFYFIAFSAPYMFGPTIRFGQMLQIKAKITITVGIVWVWNRFSIFIALICCSLVCLFNHVRSPLSFKMRFENYVFKCHHQITNAGCVH